MPIGKFNYDQYKTLEEKAKWFAYFHHGVTLHMYDGKPYHESHLASVVEIAHKFIQWIPEEARDAVLAACWAHDTIEDCRVTYNDVKAVLGYDVAEMVYALTQPKGRNRLARQDMSYYAEIRQTPYATFVKLCDRIANVEYSKETKSSMFDKYKREHAHFAEALDVTNMRYANMWTHLDDLFRNS